MKKNLLTLLFSCLTILSVRAELVWYEGFGYGPGATTNVSAGVWRIHSFGGAVGTPAGNDSFILDSRLQISGNSSTNAQRQADINRPFYTAAGGNATNGNQVIYASFTVNCTNLPTTVQNYIAHFYNGSAQQARLYNANGSLPSTWRLGINGASTSPINVFPRDLARDVNYQVVIGWNPTGGTVNGIPLATARLWINPVDSDSLSVDSGDGVGSPPAPTSFAFRQASGTTSFFVAVSNCAVATTFEEAATSVWAASGVTPVIVNFSPSATNFVNTATPVLFSGIAAGQGLGSLTYTWLKNGAIYSNPNGNTNALVTPAVSSADSGAYQLVATTPYGLSATSAVANLWVTNAPIPPTITVQPATNVLAYVDGNVTLTLTATGPGTISYTWSKNGVPVFGPNATPDYTISGLALGNTGNYRCGVTNEFGGVLSSNVVLTVTNPPAVSIGFLRTLVDPASFVPTNSSFLWQATGVVSTYTNVTTGTTAGYYLQDSTAGINIFVTGSAWRPLQGDVVTFTGFLSTFRGTLELIADTTVPGTAYTILSNNIALLPSPKVISYTITNNIPFAETNLEGSIVMLTNVFFVSAGTTNPAGGSNPNEIATTVTNASGKVFFVGFANNTDTAGKVLPTFAYSVVGPLNQLTNVHQDYQVLVTRWSDIVTNPLTLSVTHSGNSSSLTWTAASLSYPYTIWAASTVTGPYAPISSNLRFTDENGNYTDPSAGGSEQYYRLSTP